MKISEVVKQPIAEGGNAFNNVGPIHINEVEPTLKYVGCIIGVEDICKRALGSTGKKEFSGDIDIALEPKAPVELEMLEIKLQEALGKENVRKIGKLLTTSVPIQSFNPSLLEGREENVQVDFIFGDPEWLKLYYHSPTAAESNLKGTHRNIAIATICGFLDRDESNETDDFERPVKLIRWKWSPRDGLLKVKRISRRNDKSGKWLKTQKDIALSEPIKDPDEIANVLFFGNESSLVLVSAESLINAVKAHYPEEVAELIFAKMAENFTSHYDIGPKQWSYPKEISVHLDK